MKVYLKDSVERVIHDLESFTFFDILFNGVVLLINKLISVM